MEEAYDALIKAAKKALKEAPLCVLNTAVGNDVHTA